MITTKAFLSYVHEDSEIAEKIARNLQRNGIGVWRDKAELAGGQRWKEAIRTAIQNGALFISLHSKQRQARSVTYANEELLIAIEELRKRPFDKAWLIPVRIDDSKVEDRPLGGGETYLDLHIQDLVHFDEGISHLLKSLGVAYPVLAEDKRRAKRGEFTAPQGSVFAAIKALEELSSFEANEVVAIDTLQTAFGKNTIRDLSALKLISSPERGYWSLREPINDARLALAVAISSIPAFQVVVGELKKDIDVSSVTLGKKIAEYLGREWGDSSCQRNGQAYKKWVVVLYPNFQLPKLGDQSYLRARRIAREAPKKGPGTYFTPDVLVRLGQFKKKGLSIKEMAVELGIPYGSFSNWTRRQPDIWNNL